MHHINPEAYHLTPEQVYEVNRLRAAREFCAGNLAVWDSYDYPQQCRILEIMRAEAEIAKYDRMKRGG